MMKLRISITLALISVGLLTVLSVGAQSSAEKEARLIDSFGRVPNGDARGRFDLMLAEVSNNPGSIGLLYVHGTPAEIAARTRYYENQLKFRKFDPSRVKFVRGRNLGDVRLDMWLIPAGAAMPDIKPEAWIVADFGAVTITVGKRKIAAFFADKKKACSDQVYIINYGSAKQIAQREMWFRNTRISCGYDGNRITLVNGGSGPVRTVIWLVPPGAENPMP